MKNLVKDIITKETLFELSMKAEEILILLASKHFTFENNSYCIFDSTVEILPYSPIRNCEHNLNIFVTKL